jgi:hypothetical protein
LLALGLLALALAAFSPRHADPVRPIMILLLIELALATAHALWLGAPPLQRRKGLRNEGSSKCCRAVATRRRDGGKAPAPLPGGGGAAGRNRPAPVEDRAFRRRAGRERGSGLLLFFSSAN